MNNHYRFEVECPHDDILNAICLIDITLEKNDINIDLAVSYDYSFDGCGEYRPDGGEDNFRIFVNPDNCIKNNEDDQEDEISYSGSPSDSSLFGVTIHEFCHVLQWQVYPNMIKHYLEEFPTERLYLNDYSNNEICDELAEIMTLYITNPYLLKIISTKHWKFCKKYFKAPVPCSLKASKNIYHGFPIRIKENLKKKWGITFDHNEEKFVKVDK